MFIRTLSLRNFRSYSSLDLSFETRLIFFIGGNGEGKTNLLESISILSFLKSFRGNGDDEVLKWGESYYYIASIVEEKGEDFRLEYGYENTPQRRKKIKRNGNTLKKHSEAYGFLPCIVLSPMDLGIVEGSHSERRKFIDTLLGFLEPFYTNYLTEYNHLLRQRNASLKANRIDPELFHIWDQMLCEKDDQIRRARFKWSQILNIHFRKDLDLLSEGKDGFILEYKPNVSSSEEFLSKIKDSFQKDIRLGYTTIGCHRDEIFIGKNNRDILEFGSQGQRRSTVISLKTGSFQLLRNSLEKEPILLIDDVIRELDVKRRQFFVDLIRECGQAFFTTTDLEGIQDYIGELSEPKQIFHVHSGQVESWETVCNG